MRKAFQAKDLATSLDGCAKALHHLAVSYDSAYRSSLVIEAAALIEQTAVAFHRVGEKRPGGVSSPNTSMPGSGSARPPLLQPAMAPALAAVAQPRPAPGPTSFWRDKRAAVKRAAQG